MFLHVISGILIFLIQFNQVDKFEKQKAEKVLKILKQSANTHDFSILEPELSDYFQYNDLDKNLSKMVMRQVISQFPQNIKTIEINSVQENEDRFEIKTKFIYDKESEEQLIILSGDYKIISAPIVKIQMMHSPHGNNPSKKTEESEGKNKNNSKDKIPEVTEIDFKLYDKLIVVEAEVNGVKGNFIIDSAAPFLILNNMHWENKLGKVDSGEKAKGVGGEITGFKKTEIDFLKMGGIVLNSLNAGVMDLNHLAINNGIKNLLGLIGYSNLEKFSLRLDYKKEKLSLYKVDNNGAVISERVNNIKSEIIPFEMAMHVPVIIGDIGGKKLKFGIDTGAEEGMIFNRWETDLKNNYKITGIDTLRGADKNETIVNKAKVDWVKVGKLKYHELVFLFSKNIFPHDQDGELMDGLLGYEFLSKYVTEINFRKKELIIYTD